MKNYHIPVLLDEVIGFLQVKKDFKYIDATLGGGGHSEKILKLGGKVLGIDVDEDAISFAKKKLANNKNFKYEQGNFKDIEKIAHLKGFDKVSGIILDLGLSSYQIDKGEKGFSFLKKGPLDMRMDKSLNVKAKDLINILTKGELYEIFNKFGQENNAWAISDAIISARRIKPIETTDELGRAINKAYRIKGEISDFKKNEIYKRVFQALRIAVNSELENLEEGLKKGINLLEKKGRIVVISFHSLEDRIVKEKYKEFEKENLGRILTEKPILPSEEEINRNPRSKSAKLRVFEKK